MYSLPSLSCSVHEKADQWGLSCSLISNWVWHWKHKQEIRELEESQHQVPLQARSALRKPSPYGFLYWCSSYFSLLSLQARFQILDQPLLVSLKPDHTSADKPFIKLSPTTHFSICNHLFPVGTLADTVRGTRNRSKKPTLKYDSGDGYEEHMDNLEPGKGTLVIWVSVALKFLKLITTVSQDRKVWHCHDSSNSKVGRSDDTTPANHRKSSPGKRHIEVLRFPAQSLGGKLERPQTTLREALTSSVLGKIWLSKVTGKIKHQNLPDISYLKKKVRAPVGKEWNPTT